MKFGERLHISELAVGDIVRMINGQALERVFVEYLGEKIIAPEVGGPNDFRQGYDTMTVIDVTDKEVTLRRPYFHVYKDTSRSIGTEQFTAHRSHGGLWYELLQRH